MKVIEDLREMKALSPSAVALGNFDGVHLGHQALLAACKDLAAETGAKTGVVTFSAHPDTLVLGKTPPFINSPQDRKLLLQQLGGVEQVVTLPSWYCLRPSSILFSSSGERMKSSS